MYHGHNLQSTSSKTETLKWELIARHNFRQKVCPHSESTAVQMVNKQYIPVDARSHCSISTMDW